MPTERSILITGASSGIGRALALAYAGPRTFLALGGRDPGRLEEVCAACRKRGAEVQAGAVDVRDSTAMARWLLDADGRHALDLVIANAGITGGHGGAGLAESDEAVRRLIDVNLGGVVNTVQPAIGPMRRRRRGQIVLMSSLAGVRGLPYSPAYCASKAAIKAYGESLRGWLSADGIAVTVVMPGFVDTPLSRRVDSPKPLMVDADRAARKIRRAIERRAGQIAFPWILYAGMRLLDFVPSSLADRVLSRVDVAIRAQD